MRLLLDECVSPGVANSLNADGGYFVTCLRDIGALARTRSTVTVSTAATTPKGSRPSPGCSIRSSRAAQARIERSDFGAVLIPAVVGYWNLRQTHYFKPASGAPAPAT